MSQVEKSKPYPLPLDATLRQRKSRYRRKTKKKYPTMSEDDIETYIDDNWQDWYNLTVTLPRTTTAAVKKKKEATQFISDLTMPAWMNHYLALTWLCEYLETWAKLFLQWLYLMLFAPRGHGKTELVAAYVIRTLLERPQLKILLIVKDNRVALQLFMYIKEQLTYNEKILADYGERILWSSQPICSINVKGYIPRARNHSLIITSFDGGLVGLHPDIVILEDVIQEGYKNDFSQEWLVNRYRSIIEYMQSETTQYLVIGTRKSPTDFYSEIMEGYHVESFKAVELLSGDWVTKKDLDMDRRKVTTWRGSYKTLLCPNWSLERLLVNKIISPERFSSEMQNDPLPDSGLYFSADDWLTCTDEPPQPRVYYMSVDPAISKKATADFSCIMVTCIYDNVLYIVDGYAEIGVDFHTLKEDIKMFAAKYKPQMVILEENGFQEWLTQELNRETVLPLLPVKHQAVNKINRIDGLKTYYIQKKIVALEGIPLYDEYYREYRLYDRTESNSTKKDDVLDCVQMIIEQVAYYLKAEVRRWKYG